MKADTRLLSIAVLTAAGLAADAFHQPLIQPIPSRLRAQDRVRNTIHFSSINDDVSSDIDALESELAAEIEAALELAQQAIEGSTEEGLDEVANLLLEAPPNLIPAPPEDVPTESVISSVLDDEPEDTIKEVEEEQKQPLPPTTPPPPPPQTISFGETLQKAAMEEAEKLKKLLFGIKEDITETKARVEEANGTADALKLEIEASIKERDETVKTIESEFAAERNVSPRRLELHRKIFNLSLMSHKNIADAQSEAARADEALVSKMDSLASAIKEITSEVIGTKKEKEEIQETKPSRLNKVVQEAKENMLGVKKSMNLTRHTDRVNADLVQMAEEAEASKEAYDAAAIIRNERVSLQDQIDTVERSHCHRLQS
ncbi:hypothetical protein QTG54_012680 [Skeletonema marinoi]|uniref:UVR domain-containing protein n=1 Tax=Skeletonema marinoi TaxID=267567 RepID=A0AAD8XZL0_9STRA|nr:hypothetical protein QTG54_012680 [Skeletonema marinoi]